MTDQMRSDDPSEVQLPDDPTTAPFWSEALQGRLMVQGCSSCRANQFFPRPFCLACGGTDLAWISTSGRASVYSVTTVGMRVADDLEPPYQVALVDLVEGVRMIALVDEHSDVLAPGDPVEVSLAQRPGRLPRVFATSGPPT